MHEIEIRGLVGHDRLRVLDGLDLKNHRSWKQAMAGVDHPRPLDENALDMAIGCLPRVAPHVGPCARNRSGVRWNTTARFSAPATVCSLASGIRVSSLSLGSDRRTQAGSGSNVAPMSRSEPSPRRRSLGRSRPTAATVLIVVRSNKTGQPVCAGEEPLAFGTTSGGGCTEHLAHEGQCRYLGFRTLSFARRWRLGRHRR